MLFWNNPIYPLLSTAAVAVDLVQSWLKFRSINVSPTFLTVHVCLQSEPIEPRRRRHHQSMRMMIWWQYQLQSYSSDGLIQACRQNLLEENPSVPQFHPSSCMPSIRTNWTKETTSSSINENDDLMTFHMIHFALALNLWRFDTKIERYTYFDHKDGHSFIMTLVIVHWFRYAKFVHTVKSRAY